MPHYYFNLYEGDEVVVDPFGLERHDLAAARVEALAGARDIMCAEVQHGRLSLTSRIEVLDADGVIVLTLAFRDAVTLSGQ